MKKKLALILAMMMLFSAGCGKNEEVPEAPQTEIQTEFEFDECGLAYEIPEAWVEMENSNLIPSPTVSPNGEIYAKIRYSYAPDENMAELNNTDSEIPVEELMTPIVEFLVVKEENLETTAVKKELALFSTCEELPQQENFHFYFLTDYTTGIGHFSEEAQATFTELAKHLPALKDSVTTYLPDETAVQQAAANNEKYLTFMSKTLTGEPVSTTIFYNYDLTVVNFWAGYCLEDGINELETLQAFYTDLQKEHPNVNFVQVVIDTPAEQTEAAVLDAYDENGVTFTGIMPDENLAKWIMANLEGLPTTIFVDREGMPRDFKIEGMQDKDYYMETTESILNALGK